MKTKIYKSYARAAKLATTECVFIGATEQQGFAHKVELKDCGNAVIAERMIYWESPANTRTLRIFRLRNGDVGFRAFGSGIGDETIAKRIFDDESEACDFLEILIEKYRSSDKNWIEEENHEIHHQSSQN